MKKIGLAAALLCTGCIQSALTYVKAPAPKPLFSIDQILEESGLIEAGAGAAVNRPASPPYPETTLEAAAPQNLQIIARTMEAPAGSTFTLKADTKNRYVAALFYAGSGFIYLQDNSIPAQGKFVFQAGGTAGEIRIRLYHKDGRLYSEEKWFIEVR